MGRRGREYVDAEADRTRGRSAATAPSCTSSPEARDEEDLLGIGRCTRLDARRLSAGGGHRRQASAQPAGAGDESSERQRVVAAHDEER